MCNPGQSNQNQFNAYGTNGGGAPFGQGGNMGLYTGVPRYSSSGIPQYTAQPGSYGQYQTPNWISSGLEVANQPITNTPVTNYGRWNWNQLAGNTNGYGMQGNPWPDPSTITGAPQAQAQPNPANPGTIIDNAGGGFNAPPPQPRVGLPPGFGPPPPPTGTPGYGGLPRGWEAQQNKAGFQNWQQQAGAGNQAAVQQLFGANQDPAFRTALMTAAQQGGGGSYGTDFLGQQNLNQYLGGVSPDQAQVAAARQQLGGAGFVGAPHRLYGAR